MELPFFKRCSKCAWTYQLCDLHGGLGGKMRCFVYHDERRWNSVRGVCVCGKPTSQFLIVLLFFFASRDTCSFTLLSSYKGRNGSVFRMYFRQFV